MSDGNFSFQRAAWKRLKKNKGAVLGMIVIIIAIIIAVFGYFIAPDHSSYANRIVLEIGSGKPGLRQEFIKVKKERVPENTGFFKQLTEGSEDPYYYIPIVSRQQTGDSIIVQKYIGDGLSEREAWHTSQLA